MNKVCVTSPVCRQSVFARISPETYSRYPRSKRFATVK